MTRLRSTLLCAVTVAVAVSGCESGSHQDESVAEIYSAAIRWLVDDASDERPASFEKVFVEAVDEDPIPLAVQAEVVRRLEDETAVRFIDTREEAIDSAEPGDPVRDDGMLIGLGPVGDTGHRPVRVYAERYLDLIDVVAYEIGLELTDGRWQVAGVPGRMPVDNDGRGLGD